MSTRFHSKFHRHNHHTDPTADVRFPDSSHDPIASPDSPFRGTFALNGALSAFNTTGTYGGIIANPTTALILRGGTWALYADQGNTYVRNLTCSSIVISQNFSILGDAYFNRNLYVAGSASVTGSFSVDDSTLYVSSTLNRVGIGTTLPNAALTVSGVISSTQGISCNSIFSVDPITPKITLGAYAEINSNASISGTLNLNSISTLTPTATLAVSGNTAVNGNFIANTNALFVDSVTRNVGVGTIVPNKPLTVIGDIAASGSCEVGNIIVDSTTLTTDSANDRVGINTSAPNRTLTVVGDISATGEVVAGNFLLQSLNVAPSAMSFTGQLSTFDTPVTATGEYLIIKLNGVQRALRLWNF